MTKKLNFTESEIAERSLCGRYVRYNKLLGRGAFKDVYKGFDIINNVEIAWNQICLDDEITLKPSENHISLCSEAVFLKSLDHKNIMKCYSYWVDESSRTVNMITELFTCGSLRNYMKKSGSVDVPKIKNWGRQILQGLNYLHSQTPLIVHRDIKCHNIFVDVINDEVKIGDFGLATVMNQGPIRALAGTPEFMAPEYYDEEYNELVDIYAFGLSLMELATCEYPYSECTNPAQIFKKVSSGIKPIALEKVKDFEVKQIIEKCLLPASVRPSAFELLKDSFFSVGDSMELEEDSSRSCSIISSVNSSSLDNMDESSVDFRFESIGFVHDSILSDISALYNSLVICDANHDGLSSSCNQSSIGEVSMSSKITFASEDLGFY
ncbi:hypothetical protein RD792_009579 [Penstemon davidsonii]|uniref:non-specific serine/threonine protein kinase n=1 Tax=Penstemon davidsonii TaxID=160366 RepID=A0ABR0CZG3_9LAMI|nr:hypothetical protein RD792_009579 [Penstemon davidsonii]